MFEHSCAIGPTEKTGLAGHTNGKRNRGTEASGEAIIGLLWYINWEGDCETLNSHETMNTNSTSQTIRTIVP